MAKITFTKLNLPTINKEEKIKENHKEIKNKKTDR